eukprot:353919-Chlamydomonas_euryale.AAC.16
MSRPPPRPSSLMSPPFTVQLQVTSLPRRSVEYNRLMSRLRDARVQLAEQKGVQHARLLQARSLMAVAEQLVAGVVGEEAARLAAGGVSDTPAAHALMGTLLG